MLSRIRRQWWLVFAFVLAACNSTPSTDPPDQQCAPFQSQSFTIESGTRFSIETPSGNCVGAMVDSNTAFYAKADVSLPPDLPSGIEISKTAGITSLWPEHLELGIPIVNHSSNTYCSFSFETTHYLQTNGSLVFSAGPSGAITDIKYLSGGNYGYCLKPNDAGLIRKTSFAEIVLGPASRVSRVELGRLAWVDSMDLTSAQQYALAQQQLLWSITPIQLIFDGDDLELTIQNDSLASLPVETPVLLVYLDRKGNYLDFAVPNGTDLNDDELDSGEQMTLTFNVSEREVPKGRAWKLRFYFHPDLP